MAQWLRLHVSTAVGVGSIPGQRTKILHASQVEWGPPFKKRKKEISLDHLGLHDCYSSAIVSSTGGTEGKASTSRHTQLHLSPTTQNVAGLWLLDSSSLQHCSPRAFAQGNMGSARIACS